MREVRSISRSGQSDVTLEFQWGTEMDYAGVDIREKLDVLFSDATYDDYGRDMERAGERLAGHAEQMCQVVADLQRTEREIERTWRTPLITPTASSIGLLMRFSTSVGAAPGSSVRIVTVG